MPLPSVATPTSTYRLQITGQFTLHDAAREVAYLSKLGVGAVYVSPLLRAAAGSPHGYDVVDHSLVDPARGGEDGLTELAEACRVAGLGLVVDIVPNHMGVADAWQNRAWWELLRRGRAASSASWFDVDWDAGGGRILIPVLGEDFDPDRDLQVDGEVLRYHDRNYPIAPGTRRGGDSARTVLARQHYRLIPVRQADTEQNYRRFFAVSELAGLRIEDPDVHRDTHREVLRWLSAHGVTGLRIDHPDGLAEPREYLERLAASTPRTWITVEKILRSDEELPSSWPVAGTTGYDALAQINALLVDPRAEPTMERIYRDLTGDTRDWEEHVDAGKRDVATTILQAEFRRLARLVPSVDRAEEALVELAVAFPVYRSYLPEGVHHLDQAAVSAGKRSPHLVAAIELLLPRLSDPSDALCVRFQQLTGAVMAKGVEDTAFHRYTRLIGLNEVGGNPGHFGSGLAAFHAAQRRRAESAPFGLTALSTHDTKRGEDVRARPAVIPELPQEWSDVAGRLLRLAPVPHGAFGYLLWQTFVATGLIERERMHAFAEKAMREAADATSWSEPAGGFELAVHDAVDAAYDRSEVRETIVSFAEKIIPFGWSNSLAQKLIQLTMPGIPDLYQGSELYEGSLTDPDNRRPVDFASSEAALDGLDRTGQGPGPDAIPLAKMWVTWQALRARRNHPDLFCSYEPIMEKGANREHLVAFDRGGAITLATRLPVSLQQGGGWADTRLTLPAGTYRDVLTQARFEGRARIGQLLERYPVALLLKEGSQ